MYWSLDETQQWLQYLQRHFLVQKLLRLRLSLVGLNIGVASPHAFCMGLAAPWCLSQNLCFREVMNCILLCAYA